MAAASTESSTIVDISHQDALSSGSKGAWHFINTIDPGQNRSKGVQKLIKSNAMKNFRRKQRLETMAKHRRSTQSQSKVTQNVAFESSPAVVPLAEIVVSPIEGEVQRPGLEDLSALQTLSALFPEDFTSADEGAQLLPHDATFNGPMADSDPYGHAVPSPMTKTVTVLPDPFDSLPMASGAGSQAQAFHHCAFAISFLFNQCTWQAWIDLL